MLPVPPTHPPPNIRTRDNVLGTHVKAPNLDENQRASEAARAKKVRMLGAQIRARCVWVRSRSRLCVLVSVCRVCAFVRACVCVYVSARARVVLYLLLLSGATHAKMWAQGHTPSGYWIRPDICFFIILILLFTPPPPRPPVCSRSRAVQHPSLTKDLNYNVDDTILRKRVHTPIISKTPFNPLRNE